MLELKTKMFNMAKSVKKEAVLTGNAAKIKEARERMEKKYGEGVMMRANEKSQFHECIPTGSLGLDKALGIGGLAKGRIVEIFGPESSGKTTLCLEIIRNAHKKDPDAYALIVDTEHAIDLKYAEALGIDLNRLDISQPDYGEQALEIASEAIESGAFAVVVVDSIAALVPKSELDGDMGDASMGKHARLMSQAMRKLTPITSKTNTLLIFTNQLRDKIGVMFGSPETTTGGNAMKFYASVRLDVRRSVTAQNSVMEGDLKVGNLTKVKVIKNKLAPPFRECEFNIRFGEGIDDSGELLDMAVELNIIDKKASYFSYNGETLAQGREAARIVLRDNQNLFNEIKEKVELSFVPKEFEPTEKELQENDNV